jgi:hypothetical protein
MKKFPLIVLMTLVSFSACAEDEALYKVMSPELRVDTL